MDYHIHTNFSDGEASYKEVIDLSIALGLKTIAITDHFDLFDPKLKDKPMDYQRLYEHFCCIKEYKADKPIEVLCGIETCTDDEGNLRIEDNVWDLCDLIITSPHYIELKPEVEKEDYFNPYYWECYKEKVLKMAKGKGHVLGHPEGYLPIGEMLIPNHTTYESRKLICKEIAEKFFDDKYICEMGEYLRRSGKAYELHGATSTPRERVIQLLAKKNIEFSIGSDAHSLDILGRNEWAYSMVNKYGLNLIFNKTRGDIK